MKNYIPTYFYSKQNIILLLWVTALFGELFILFFQPVESRTWVDSDWQFLLWVTIVVLVAGTRIFGTLLDGKNMYHELSAVSRQQPAIIIMGNEGNGISEEVRKWIMHPLRIPSYPEGAETSESLNVAIATAVVLAEFRRVLN